MQLIKAGKEGVFYQARMSRGTCKGHGMFTCKISKEGDKRRPGSAGTDGTNSLAIAVEPVVCLFLEVSVTNMWRRRFPS